MMKVITVLLVASSLAGCFVRTGPAYGPRREEARRSCPPAHHWEGGYCVHNGNGRHRGHR